MSLLGKYGDKPTLVFRDGPLAAAACVDGEVAIIPENAGCSYRLVSLTHAQGTASTSGTVMYRAISDTSAADATAGATVKDLHTALSNASTAKTPVATTPTAGVLVSPGDRIVRDCGGTQTNLVDYIAVLVFEPAFETT